jgi:hypothetical protein
MIGRNKLAGEIQRREDEDEQKRSVMVARFMVVCGYNKRWWI